MKLFTFKYFTKCTASNLLDELVLIGYAHICSIGSKDIQLVTIIWKNYCLFIEI